VKSLVSQLMRQLYNLLALGFYVAGMFMLYLAMIDPGDVSWAGYVGLWVGAVGGVALAGMMTRLAKSSQG
jgi:hypothetical protein